MALKERDISGCPLCKGKVIPTSFSKSSYLHKPVVTSLSYVCVDCGAKFDADITADKIKLNAQVEVERETEEIKILGVENWRKDMY